MIAGLATLLVVSSALIAIVLLRQLYMTARFLIEKPTPIPDLPNVPLPSVAILIPAHNEEKVIAGCLDAMRRINYPADLLEVIVINDRSGDATGQIADSYASLDQRIRVIHRAPTATPGKPAALADTISASAAEVMVFFDADYLPPPSIVRQLVDPFRDPQVGATMGRVVPYNSDENMLTKLIDLERRAGYVIDQEMRHRLGLLPQFGGTCGAVRRSALDAVGGWFTDVLTEDTDLTYRLFLNGFSVSYVKDALCYEESPETWQVRFRQVRRWAYGHNDCLFRYFIPVLRTQRQPLRARIDAAVVLLFYAIPALALFSLFATLLVPTVTQTLGPLSFTAPALLVFCSFGNFAPYLQIAAGCAHDRQPGIFVAVPMLYLSSFISMVASVAGLLGLLRDRAMRRRPHWDKTNRFRRRMEGPI